MRSLYELMRVIPPLDMDIPYLVQHATLLLVTGLVQDHHRGLVPMNHEKIPDAQTFDRGGFAG